MLIILLRIYFSIILERAPICKLFFLWAMLTTGDIFNFMAHARFHIVRCKVSMRSSCWACCCRRAAEKRDGKLIYLCGPDHAARRTRASDPLSLSTQHTHFSKSNKRFHNFNINYTTTRTGSL